MCAGSPVRFDAESERFLSLACAYLSAVEQGDRLFHRIERAEEHDDFSKAKKLRRKLGEVEARIDAARAELTSHTRRTARSPMRERSRLAKLSRVFSVAKGVA